MDNCSRRHPFWLSYNHATPALVRLFGHGCTLASYRRSCSRRWCVYCGTIAAFCKLSHSRWCRCLSCRVASKIDEFRGLRPVPPTPPDPKTPRPQEPQHPRPQDPNNPNTQDPKTLKPQPPETHLAASCGHLGELLVPSWGHLGAVLGPSWGPLGPSWALLGPSWALLGPLGASWGHPGVCWGHLGTIFGPLWSVFGPSRGHLGPNLGPSWAQLGPTWVQLGTSWGHGRLLGAVCGPLWNSTDIKTKSAKTLGKTDVFVNAWSACLP